VGTPNSQMQNSHLYLAEYYSIATCTTTLYKVRNDSEDSTWSTPSDRSPCWQQ